MHDLLTGFASVASRLYETALLDVLRTLLVFGLVYAAWVFRLGSSTRPVHDFVRWGLKYPPVFAVFAVQLLIVWGVIGQDFGLQNLFIVDDSLVQFELGMASALFFLGLDFLFLVVDSSEANWRMSLRYSLDVNKNLTGFLPGSLQVERLLRNGLLDELGPETIERIRCAAKHEGAPGDQRSEMEKLKPLIENLDFRQLMAPAILVAGGFLVVLLLGLPPLIASHFRVWPWVAGLSVGSCAAILLSCWASTLVLYASGSAPAPEERLKRVKNLIDELPPPADAEGVSSRDASPFFTRFLVFFFLIHVLVYGVCEFAPPTQLEALFSPGVSTVLQLAVLVVPVLELIGALIIAWVSPAAVRFVQTACKKLPEGVRHWTVGFVDILVLGLIATAVLQAAKHRGSGTGLGFLLLLLYPLTWLLSFISVVPIRALASYVGQFPSADGRARIASFNTVAGSCLLFGIGILLWANQCQAWAEVFVAVPMIAVLCSGALGPGPISTWMSVLGRIGNFRIAALIVTLLVIAWWLAVGSSPWPTVAWILLGLGALAGPAYLWRVRAKKPELAHAVSGLLGLAALLGALTAWHLGAGSSPWPTAAWILLGIAVLSGLVHWSLIEAKKQELAYPVSGLFGFAAFAVVYNTLELRHQLLIPAGASILALFGLVALTYLAVKAAGPRKAATAMATIVLGVFALNGNAWLAESNHFKLQFPGLETSYTHGNGGSPTWLDSRAYLRSTTGSVMKLFNPQLTRDLELEQLQGKNQRAGSGTFEVCWNFQKKAVKLTVTDLRGRFHAAKGDWIRLVLSHEVLLRKGPQGVSNYWRFRAPNLDAAILNSEHLRMCFERPGATAPPKKNAPKRRDAMTVFWLTSEGRAKVQPTDWDQKLFRAENGQLDVLNVTGEIPASAAFAAVWKGSVEEVNDVKCTIHFGDDTGIQKLVDQCKTPQDIKDVEDALREQIQESHLIHCQPEQPLGRKELVPGVANGRFDSLGPEPRDGDCVVLTRDCEGARGIVETFYKPRGDAQFRPLSTRSLDDLKNAKPDVTFALRRAHERGVFRASKADPRGIIRLARHERVRVSDRLILRWIGSDKVERCQMFCVSSRAGDKEGDKRNADPGLENFKAFTLEPIGAGTPRSPAENTREPWVEGVWQLAVWPLDNIEVLESWKRRMPESPSRKPPLVIITVSGGGIRASVWAGTVLHELERRLGPCFPYHIRLVTGASGGMVAASQYVTSLPEPPPPGGKWGHSDCEWKALERLNRDQLNAVAGCMAFNDIPGLLNPIQRVVDRGRKLEETWEWLTSQQSDEGAKLESPLRRPLRSFAADELAGWRPSLVFTPMLVEDGRRVLISNLNLAFVARDHGRLLMERDSRRIDPAYLEDLKPELSGDDDLLSLSAVEFFRLFPRAWDFKVSTAIRMSASFPLVSPAVSLPTLPPRRVVDAGYYDNYGVNIAAQWLTKLREWLVSNTGGVVVIQIRDWISQQARTQLDFDRGAETVSNLLDRVTWRAGKELLAPGFYPTNTPIQGVSSARQWSMSFRNDEQVELFDMLLRDAVADDPGFFRTVVFECPVRASLSWTLTEREKEQIRRGLGLGMDPNVSVNDLRMEVREQIESWKADLHQDFHYRGKTPEQTYGERRKELYQKQLSKFGFDDIGRLQANEVEDLYNNIMNNRERLEMLERWWCWRLGGKPAEGSPCAPPEPKQR